MIISSHSNSRIKEIRSLHNRKARERTGLAFIEGIHIVAEAVQLAGAVELLVTAPELLTSAFAQEFVAAQTQRGLPYLEVTPEVFKSISLKDNPQGIAAVVRQRWEPLEHVRLTNELWVALDAVQDPGNLGTILRTCDAVGCTGLILIGQSTDPYDPTALRASMGAIFSMRLVKTGFEAFADWKQRHQYYVAGTSGAAPVDYQTIAYPLSLVLLMGSERLGLSTEQQAICDTIVKIPMVGRSDSLNLAVSTGVILYEIFNQHRKDAT